MTTPKRFRSIGNTAGLALVSFLGMSALTGCLVVGASSSGGAFIWPGGLGLILMLLVVFLLMRRR